MLGLPPHTLPRRASPASLLSRASPASLLGHASPVSPLSRASPAFPLGRLPTRRGRALSPEPGQRFAAGSGLRKGLKQNPSSPNTACAGNAGMSFGVWPFAKQEGHPRVENSLLLQPSNCSSCPEIAHSLLSCQPPAHTQVLGYLRCRYGYTGSLPVCGG